MTTLCTSSCPGLEPVSVHSKSCRRDLGNWTQQGALLACVGTLQQVWFGGDILEVQAPRGWRKERSPHLRKGHSCFSPWYSRERIVQEVCTGLLNTCVGALEKPPHSLPAWGSFQLT